MLSQVEENYIKAIYKLSASENEMVSTNSIADVLQTKASSVSDMLKRLFEKEMINYVKYQGVSLTDNGERAAIGVVRKHRLWEVFLVSNLGFKWDEVHDIAEQLEHVRSPMLVDKLDAYLNYPKYDPHGDPIPNSKGHFPKSTALALSHLKLHEKGTVVGVVIDEPDFLKYLDKLSISLGASIVLIETNEFDQSLDVLINEKKSHLSFDVANNILINISYDG